ncbi:MAG: hypothetical protein LUG95_05000 [Clostridiales bacterium]|nr:hypothetical protein [Clostridiales bacterium]
MTENEKYFISLLSSFLNSDKAPTPSSDINWDEIYRLSQIHNVSAISANQ